MVVLVIRGLAQFFAPDSNVLVADRSAPGFTVLEANERNGCLGHNAAKYAMLMIVIRTMVTCNVATARVIVQFASGEVNIYLWPQSTARLHCASPLSHV